MSHTPYLSFLTTVFANSLHLHTPRNSSRNTHHLLDVLLLCLPVILIFICQSEMTTIFMNFFSQIIRKNNLFTRFNLSIIRYNRVIQQLRGLPSRTSGRPPRGGLQKPDKLGRGGGEGGLRCSDVRNWKKLYSLFSRYFCWKSYLRMQVFVT